MSLPFFQPLDLAAFFLFYLFPARGVPVCSPPSSLSVLYSSEVRSSPLWAQCVLTSVRDNIQHHGCLTCHRIRHISVSSTYLFGGPHPSQIHQIHKKLQQKKTNRPKIQRSNHSFVEERRREEASYDSTMGATETTSLVANGNGEHKGDAENMKKLKSYQPCA